MTTQIQDDPAAARAASGTKLHWRIALLLIVGNTALFGIGIGLCYVPHLGVASLALTIPAAALLTFVVFFTDSRDIRTAITASFLVLYIGFVSASFNTRVTDLAAMKDSFFATVFNDFNSLMLAIVGFYFGGKALETASGRVAEAQKDRSKDSSRVGGSQGDDQRRGQGHQSSGDLDQGAPAPADETREG
jgi:hypothetical protein